MQKKKKIFTNISFSIDFLSPIITMIIMFIIQNVNADFFVIV